MAKIDRYIKRALAGEVVRFIKVRQSRSPVLRKWRMSPEGTNPGGSSAFSPSPST